MNMFIVYIAVALIATVDAVEFILTNNEVGPIWVGIQGTRGQIPLENGGIELQAFETLRIFSPEDWSGRFWARTWCSNQTYHCLTGDCGDKFQCEGKGPTAPATYVEINLKGSEGLHYYVVNLMQGYNLAIAIEPVDAENYGDPTYCKKAECIYFRKNCPKMLQVDTPLGLGGCLTACNYFKTNQYCCRGRYGNRRYCNPSQWPVNYNEIYKKHCPNAHTYTFDDNKTIYTCVADKYKITFGGPN